jgi:hypothetical protein
MSETEVEEIAAKMRDDIASGKLSAKSYVTKYNFETHEVTALVGQVPILEPPDDERQDNPSEAPIQPESEVGRDELHQQAEERFKRDIETLERLEIESPGDWVAVVLSVNAEDRSRTVLISPNSELNAVLQASGEFEVVDKSWHRNLTLGRHFQRLGLLQAKRRNGEWRLEFPDYCTPEGELLMSVESQIEKLLRADRKESQPA